VVLLFHLWYLKCLSLSCCVYMTAFLLVAILPDSVRLIDKPVNRKFWVNRLTVNIPSFNPIFIYSMSVVSTSWHVIFLSMIVHVSFIVVLLRVLVKWNGSHSFTTFDKGIFQQLFWVRSFSWLVTRSALLCQFCGARCCCRDTAHQTLAVSIKKPISMARTFCKDALNEFAYVASSALVGRLFDLFIDYMHKIWRSEV